VKNRGRGLFRKRRYEDGEVSLRTFRGLWKEGRPENEGLTGVGGASSTHGEKKRLCGKGCDRKEKSLRWEGGV